MGNRVLAIGEVLWDLLPSGRKLGGAPANFAYHCRALGADARLVTRIGADALGQEVLERFRQVELPTDTVTVDPAAPTGTVLVELGPGGQPRFTIQRKRRLGSAHGRRDRDRPGGKCPRHLLRQPRPAERAGPAGDPITHRGLACRWTADLRRQSPAAVRRSRGDRGFPGTGHSAQVERPGTARLRGRCSASRGASAIRWWSWLAASASRWWRSTRGEHGSLLWADGTWSDHPGLAVEVCDTVGAGDAFTAALTVGLLAGWGLDAINERANQVAAFVCTKPGGMPATARSAHDPVPLAPGGTAVDLSPPRPDLAGSVAVPTSAGSLSGTLIFSTIVASLGGLLFGFDTAVISGTTDALTEVFQLSSFSLGFTVASALLGTILGSVLVSRPADVWGRNRTLAVLAVFYFVSAVGCATGLELVSRSWRSASWAVSRWAGRRWWRRMYIAEISPARLRGRLVGVMQFNVVLGILLAFLSNYLIAWMYPGPTAWRWMFGVQAFPSARVLLPPLPDAAKPRAGLLPRAGWTKPAPSWESLAQTPAAWTRRSRRSSRHWTLSTTGPSRCSSGSTGGRSCWPWRSRCSISFRASTRSCITPRHLHEAGAGSETALLQAVAVGGTNLVFTMLAMSVIDRVGRRRLMLIGSIGYILSLGTTAWAFYTYGTSSPRPGAWWSWPSLLALHRVARVRPGSRDLGVHQRDLPEPGSRRGPGAGQLHALDHGRR